MGHPWDKPGTRQNLKGTLTQHPKYIQKKSPLGCPRDKLGSQQNIPRMSAKPPGDHYTTTQECTKKVLGDIPGKSQELEKTFT